VFSYSGWMNVLAALGLKQAKASVVVREIS
jgi:hypothetical protein